MTTTGTGLMDTQKEQARYQRQAKRDAAREERRAAMRQKHEFQTQETNRLLKSQQSEDSHVAIADSSSNNEKALPKDSKESSSVPADTISTLGAESREVIATQLLGKALLIKMKIQMELKGKGWYYKDASMQVQGPFEGEAMANWYKLGYLSSELQVSSSHNGDFYSLSTVMEGALNPAAAFREELDANLVIALRSGLSSLI